MKINKLAALLVWWVFGCAWAFAGTLLPNGKQQFFNNSGQVNSGGFVYFYVPGTTTPKTTWQDANNVTANANPVPLDSNGTAIIYGSGQYREVVYDSSMNLVFDQLTTDTSANAVAWGGIATGTANALTLSSSTFSFSTGQILLFTAGSSNSGATTLNVNGTGAYQVYKTTSSGLSAFQGGEFIAGSSYQVMVNAAANAYVLIGPNTLTWVGAQTTLASAATTDLGTIASHNVLVSGTTAITSFGVSANVAQPWYQVCFSGALTITYNGTSLILPSGQSIVTAAGDCLQAIYLGSSNWQVVGYQRSSGQPTVVQLAPMAVRLTATNNPSNPNTQITVSFKYAQLTSATLSSQVCGANSFTVNSATNGVLGLDFGTVQSNTWYYYYVIGNGSSCTGILSGNPSNPTLPSGYSFYAYLGAIKTDSSLAFYRINQVGNRTDYLLTSSTNTGGYFTLGAGTINVGAFAPATATIAFVSTNGSGTGVGANAVQNLIYSLSNAGNAQTISFGTVLQGGTIYVTGSALFEGWIDGALNAS